MFRIYPNFEFFGGTFAVKEEKGTSTNLNRRESGAIKPIVARTFALEDAAQAGGARLQGCGQIFSKTKSDDVFGQRRRWSKMFRVRLAPAFLRTLSAPSIPLLERKSKAEFARTRASGLKERR